MSDDITLPPGARLDPRRGQHGGQYVILTCAICGREVRHPLPWYRALLWFTAGFLLGVVTTALGLLWMMTMAVVA
jgi:hypothetical protein